MPCSNVSPLISVEGNELISDTRRGQKAVWDRTMDGLQNCLKLKLLTGVCTSLCQTNMDLLTEGWLDRLIEMGVMYAWFHIYRAVGPNSCPDLSLRPEQQRQQLLQPGIVFDQQDAGAPWLLRWGLPHAHPGHATMPRLDGATS